TNPASRPTSPHAERQPGRADSPSPAAPAPTPAHTAPSLKTATASHDLSQPLTLHIGNSSMSGSSWVQRPIRTGPESAYGTFDHWTVDPMGRRFRRRTSRSSQSTNREAGMKCRGRLRLVSAAVAVAMLVLAGGAVAAVPTITRVSPAAGGVGAAVTINGSGFTGATDVSFNGTAASFTVVSDARVSTSVPFGATTGAISVTTPDGAATSGIFK